jgi:hypothetical protein
MRRAGVEFRCFARAQEQIVVAEHESEGAVEDVAQSCPSWDRRSGTA